MDSIDNFRERFEALEQQTEQLRQQTQTLEAQTHTLARQARWWRGIAYGLGLLGLVSLPLQSGTAADTQPGGMADRMAAVENKLRAMTFDDAANEVVITGANLRIVNGLGTTDTTNRLGNLIVGYNEERGGQDNRTGSHNVVVGRGNNFSSFGGVVVGQFNEISGQFASVSGGTNNTASGNSSSVSGGFGNTASGDPSIPSLIASTSVSGGTNNTATGLRSASVSGGTLNTANGIDASISGGFENTASGNSSSVSGGFGNTASGDFAAVGGGERNIASGSISSVSGGFLNSASGDESSVSGGNSRSAPAQFNWAAGPLFADN
jgi:hypothetical protein